MLASQSFSIYTRLRGHGDGNSTVQYRSFACEMSNREAEVDMQHNKEAFLFDAADNPFHVAGTRIYREPAGTLSYECPHCGQRWVPRRLISDLAKYATERGVTWWPSMRC